jgi:hypothetical protein
LDDRASSYPAATHHAESGGGDAARSENGYIVGTIDHDAAVVMDAGSVAETIQVIGLR